jgi:glutathione S-transferase
MKLYFHPLSSYSQKVLIALYEKNAPFESEIFFLGDPEQRAAYLKVAPLGKVPLLVDTKRDHAVPESAIILEYLDTHAGGPRLIPQGVEEARQARFQERLADCYFSDPVTKIVTDGHRPQGKQDPFGVQSARDTLDRVLPLLDRYLANKKAWALGDAFSNADCAYAPPLAYMRKLHPFTAHKNVSAYFERLVQRPSVTRVLREAEPYLARVGM